MNEEKETYKLISGNEAAAYAAALARVEVIAAYPITPATPIVEKIADLMAAGEFATEFIRVESEHSAMASCIGASMAGARTFTSTSSQGIALMHEMLHWAAGARCPVVLVCVNRALAAPWSILTDQSDSLSQRDTGWIQYYCESAQEVLDSVLQAYRVAEQSMLPAMVCLDGFYLSHTLEEVCIPPRKAVDSFLPSFDPIECIRLEEPVSFGGLASPGRFQQLRESMHAAMEKALGLARDADDEYARLIGRSYGLLVPYECEDAETIIVSSGTVCSTLEIAVDELRSRGDKVGSLRVRLFRPFPRDDFVKIIAPAKRLIVLDRNFSNGVGGIFAQEIKAHLYNLEDRPPVYAFVGGLGGGDFPPELLLGMYERTMKSGEPWHDIEWLA
jgi:pyruvate/2-oxoacid:ferredoxin oxidoreductase alpha subunit